MDTAYPINLWQSEKAIIGLIYRHFYQCSNSESLFQMYILLVHPILSVQAKFGIPTRLYLDLFTMFKIVHSLFYFPSGVFVEQAPRVTRSQSRQFHMHIQVAFIILLYPVQYVTGICSLHMYPCLFLLLYHHLKLTSGHTCKISYCTAILCVLASMLNLS